MEVTVLGLGACDPLGDSFYISVVEIMSNSWSLMGLQSAGSLKGTNQRSVRECVDFVREVSISSTPHE